MNDTALETKEQQSQNNTYPWINKVLWTSSQETLSQISTKLDSNDKIQKEIEESMRRKKERDRLEKEEKENIQWNIDRYNNYMPDKIRRLEAEKSDLFYGPFNLRFWNPQGREILNDLENATRKIEEIKWKKWKNKDIENKINEILISTIWIILEKTNLTDEKKFKLIWTYIKETIWTNIDLKYCIEKATFQRWIMDSSYMAELAYVDRSKLPNWEWKQTNNSLSKADQTAVDKIINSWRFKIIDSIKDPDTWFSASVIENTKTKEKIISFRWTDINEFNDKVNDVFIGIGIPPLPQVKKMIQYMDWLKKRWIIKSRERPNIVWHSLWWVLAQICSAMYETNQTFTFNSPWAQLYSFDKEVNLNKIKERIPLKLIKIVKEVKNTLIDSTQEPLTPREEELFQKFDIKRFDKKLNNNIISIKLDWTDPIKYIWQDMWKRFNIKWTTLVDTFDFGKNHSIKTVVKCLINADIGKLLIEQTNMEQKFKERYPDTETYLIPW